MLDDESPAWNSLGESEMAARLVAFDWSRTPLGPIEAWPQSLKSVVAICLHSPFQMAIYWGPDLNCIYNDAERDVLGGLHPRALGLPAHELLRDSWDVTGPQLRGVMESGRATLAEDQPLMSDRRGMLEVGYFTYSYSPILDDEGTVGGVLLVTQDTTHRVLAERRLEALRELAARSMDAPTEQRACRQAAQALTRGPDVPFALIYLLDGDRQHARCVAASARWGEPQPARAEVALDRAEDPLSAPFDTLAERRSDGLLVESRLFVAADPDHRQLPQQAFVAPIARGGSEPIRGFIVAGISDELKFEQAYGGFLKMAVSGVGRSVAAARARESERERGDAIAALDRAKTSFFGDASHELRTPLSLILGNLGLLLEDRDLPPTA